MKSLAEQVMFLVLLFCFAIGMGIYVYVDGLKYKKPPK